MWRCAVGGLVGTLLLAVPSAAPAELAFVSQRCDEGGVTQPRGPFTPGGEGICRYGIFRMADDGSSVKRLTNSLNPGEEEDPERSSADTEPSWSPTGTEIVFQRQQQNGDSYARLFVMTANGATQRRLIADPGLLRAERNPAWSPLGTHIAFDGYEDVPGELPFVGIFTVRADGSGLRRVSIAGRGADRPVFMPDGRLVYYERSTPGPKHPRIHTEPDRGLVATDITGENITPITFGEATPLFYDRLAFSPDGRYLATHTTLMGKQDARLWVMRLDTGEMWPATEGPIGPPEPRYAGTPTFSLLGPALFYTDGYHTGSVKRVALRPGATPTTVAEDRVFSLAWSLLGGVLPPIPKDVLPPAVTLGPELPRSPAGSRRRVAASQSPSRSRIPFFAVDYSGIDRLDAAVGLRVKGGCRFLQGTKLGARRSCSKPRYVRVRSVKSWRERTAQLPDGKYQVRFRATDVRGNRTAAPRAHVVRLK